MASLVKTYQPEKLLGQIYTPDFIVSKMLDDCGFSGPGQLGKKILDPACGDGRFLTEVVRRIIAWSTEKELEKNLLAVHGWDVDTLAVACCRQNLDQLAAEKGLKTDWNLSVRNSLEAVLKNNLFVENQSDFQFDFIVGNPPYVRIQHLEETQRRFVQAHFQFCKSGSTDLFIAFFELAFQLLSADGTGAFIAPNTWLNTETGKALRHHFSTRKTLRQLTNYGDLQLFENATTYSAIVVFNKEKQSDFKYEKAISKTGFSSRRIGFDELNTEKFWQLSIEKPVPIEGKKLKEICRILVGITTLLDKAYFFPAQKLDENFFLADTSLAGKIKLEAGILKPIVKVSTLKSGSEPIREYALFPYEKQNSRHILLEEEDLKFRFPLAHAYLVSIKAELAKRDNGRPVPGAWFGYGRTQGLETSFGKKILFSPMAMQPNFMLHEDAEATFYSGYCLRFDGDQEWLLSQLNSRRMADFIAVSSRDFRGGWKAYNKKIVEEFTVAWPPPGG